MRKYLYVIIPVVAFTLIFTNAFFGHELLGSAEQVANKYSVYVHLQPEWKSDSKNIIFEVTSSWYKIKQENKNQSFNAKDMTYNENQLQYIKDKSFVHLQHSFSDCQEEWQPMLYRKAIDTVRHEIEYIQGTQLSVNPDISIYPNIENSVYDLKTQQNLLEDSFVQFIPICTQNEKTSYEFSIKTDNEDIGFDVYFVESSKEAIDFFSEDEKFDYYENESCYGQNKQSYSGTCKNISKDSGLLIIIPDELNPWVTKFTVNLYEAKDKI